MLSLETHFGRDSFDLKVGANNRSERQMPERDRKWRNVYMQAIRWRYWSRVQSLIGLPTDFYAVLKQFSFL